MRKVLIIFACVLLSSCSVKKHAVTHTEQHTTEHSQRTSLQTEFRFDSVLQQLTLQADSVIIRYETTPTQLVVEERGRTAASSNSRSEFPSCKQVLTITAHRPKVQAQTNKSNLALVQTVEQDSATSQTQANSHADNSKEVVGVARPMNGTWVVIVLALIAVLALVLLLWLHKKRII